MGRKCEVTVSTLDVIRGLHLNHNRCRSVGLQHDLAQLERVASFINLTYVPGIKFIVGKVFCTIRKNNLGPEELVKSLQFTKSGSFYARSNGEFLRCTRYVFHDVSHP